MIHISISKLRHLNATSLRTLRDAIVVHAAGIPTAVVVPYADYLEMQERLTALRSRIEAHIELALESRDKTERI